MRRKLGEIEKDLKGCIAEQKALSEKRSSLEKERLATLRGERFRCSKCEIKITLSKWVFIQAAYREPVHGCMGEGDWHYRTPDKCGIRCPKCRGYFYLPRLAHDNKLSKIMEKVGLPESLKLFGSIEDLPEKELLMLCKG